MAAAPCSRVLGLCSAELPASVPTGCMGTGTRPRCLSLLSCDILMDATFMCQPQPGGDHGACQGSVSEGPAVRSAGTPLAGEG